MRILITGHRGFVGRELVKAYDGHEIYTLDASKDFHRWMTRDLPKALRPQDLSISPLPLPLDVVFHVGALNNNQHRGSDIYLWNSTATYLIAHAIATQPHLRNCHLVFFSSRCGKWARDLSYQGGASPYGLSKMIAEDYINELLPERASILQPQNIWGDESNLYTRRSAGVPYMLATHTLKYLFHNLSRDFIHLDDVVQAAIDCATHRHVGTFEVGTGKCTTAQELRDAIEWKDYEIREPEAGRFLLPEGVGADIDKWVPGWKPQIEVIPQMQVLERAFNDDSSKKNIS